MCVPLLILSVGSIYSGFLLKEIFVGLGSTFFNNAIFILPQHLLLINSEFVSHFFKILPTIFGTLGAILSLLSYKYFLPILLKIKMSFLGQKCYNFF